MSGVNGAIGAALRAHLEAFAASARESVASAGISAASQTFTAASAIFSDFRQGDSIIVTGFASPANNGDFIVTAATATSLTVAGDLTTEGAGATVIIEARQVPEGRIAWENEGFDPNSEEDPYLAGTLWLRPTLLPGWPTQATMGDAGFNRQVGLYQVSLFWPKYEGTTAAQALADALASWFKRGTTLTNGTTSVHVTAAGSEAAGFGTVTEEQQMAAWHHVPIRIGYQAMTMNT
ncbi:MAG: DUF4128 domain-containing protein [Deltaproteobacteria bacterium]|nr:DUF4128 domain-containing protein [Deltaproteobacteria bacterium]